MLLEIFVLEININDGLRVVEIWLTNAEKNDMALRKGLKDISKRCKEKDYLLVIFESGTKDLYEGTLDLLLYNKRRSTELSAKGQH